VPYSWSCLVGSRLLAAVSLASVVCRWPLLGAARINLGAFLQYVLSFLPGACVAVIVVVSLADRQAPLLRRRTASLPHHWFPLLFVSVAAAVVLPSWRCCFDFQVLQAADLAQEPVLHLPGPLPAAHLPVVFAVILATACGNDKTIALCICPFDMKPTHCCQSHVGCAWGAVARSSQRCFPALRCRRLPGPS
jgi:hypothetical protein